jgi:hypothetical protein
MPWTFACPRCPATGSHRVVVMEHQAGAHPGLVAGEPTSSFRSQVKAQTGADGLISVLCRACARPAVRVEEGWIHEADGSPASVA